MKALCGVWRFCLDPELVPVKLKLKLELMKLNIMMQASRVVWQTTSVHKRIQLIIKTFLKKQTILLKSMKLVVVTRENACTHTQLHSTLMQ